MISLLRDSNLLCHLDQYQLRHSSIHCQKWCLTLEMNWGVLTEKHLKNARLFFFFFN